MKVSWSYRLKVQHWRAVWSRAVCKFKSHQITLELPANLCNGHQVRSTMRNKLRGFSGPSILFGEIHIQADVHCKVLWWPNQGVIKIHDPFANLVFVGITSLNSTCGQQTLHPIRKWKARLNSHWNQPSLLLDDHDINIAASTTNDKPQKRWLDTCSFHK